MTSEAKPPSCIPSRPNYFSRLSRLLRCFPPVAAKENPLKRGTPAAFRPGNPKAKFFTNPQFPANPDEWLVQAQQRSGSWWEHWREWIVARSGDSRLAPKVLGDKKHPPREPAPGTYVFET